MAVVDVRDDDYEGGHIKGCVHSPSASLLSGGVDQLREKLKDTPVVVFHCALSQVRGPKAARVRDLNASLHALY
jgi:rhodanese-related sulfurtransferase